MVSTLNNGLRHFGTGRSRAWILSAVCLWSLDAQAIDFKIDIPQLREDKLDELSAAPLPSRQIPKDPIDGDDGNEDEETLAEVETADFSLPLPDSPIPEPQTPVVESEPVTLASGAPTIYETDAFPVPACLEPNVAFWKSIYRDVDTDEALVHDRDDLSRVFGKVNLSGSSHHRRQIMSQVRENYEAKLNSLAHKLAKGTPKARLSAQDRELLSVFAQADQNAPEIRRAAERIRIQSGLQTRFDEGVKRSLELMPMITGVLRKYDVPKDIVFLPHVESSYIRTARSKVGAVGLWQIMPGTMRALKGRWAVSKRTDPRISTEAAAKLLRQNHKMLGSWPLALTAYNHGPAGVARGVRATGSKDLCTIIANYNSRSFRFASSNFYAQFLAARHVALDKYRTLALSKTHSKVLQPLLAYATREQVTEKGKSVKTN